MSEGVYSRFTESLNQSAFPVPNSTEMGIRVGNVRAGWLALLVVDGPFILPAMFRVLAWGSSYLVVS